MALRDTIRDALDTTSGTPASEVYQYLLQVDQRLGPHNDGVLYTYLREASEALQHLVNRIDQEQQDPPESSH